MNKKIMNTITGCFIVTILILSGCTTKDTNQETEQETPYPLFSYAKKTTYQNETIWATLNVSSELNKTFYMTDSEIESIVNWYENKEHIGDYQLQNGGSSGLYLTNIDPENISYGYVKIHKNNKTEGLFVFAVKALEEMNLEKENLLGVATGPWELINNCKKIGNFTELD